MEIAGYLASALIGISLGMVGGGGSILTVPVLVYLFHTGPVIATAYSLFIVGSSSLAGAVQKIRSHSVNFRIALIFGLPSLITVFVFRKVIVPLIPGTIVLTGSLKVLKDDLILILFAMLMLVASWSMLKAPARETSPAQLARSVSKLILQGIVTGIISGLLGAGGGFIIIPSLVFFAGLDIKHAIGTSLLIIATNSLIGFCGDLNHFDMDWTLLLSISALAIAGSFIGNYISQFVSSQKLRKAFGWFILGMAIVIITQEFFIKQ